MDGHVLPPLADLYVMRPLWANHFENAMAVQFQHRMLAYLICGLVLWQAIGLDRAGPTTAARRATMMAVLVVLQAAIGIMTLLLVVPLWAALLHQAVAVALLAMATINARVAADGAPDPALHAAALRP
jgi:cytochrome c oxidase assembly protein subunit 15